MATTNSRLLRASSNSLVPSSSTCSSVTRPLKCLNKLGAGDDNNNNNNNGSKVACSGSISRHGKSHKEVAVKTAIAENCLTAADPVGGTVGQGVGLVEAVSASVLSVSDALAKALTRPAVMLELRKFDIQMFIERAIVNCRFFTLFAVAGSLLGSIVCFLEGCRFVVESYLHYFNSLSGTSDQGHLMQLLLEAIDMFMVGTALLIFGIGIYVMFVGTKDDSKDKELRLSGSNFFGFFHFKSLPTWVNMQSVTQAKSKVGHAVLMILQVGLLDKFKHIPLVTCWDLACFGATVLISSACIFLLSRLSGDRTWN